MAAYYYQTNGEEVQCVNCKNKEFSRLDPVGGIIPYECGRCHFVSWFPEYMAPATTPPKK